MSLRLYFQSFDWQRFEEFLSDAGQPLAEFLSVEVLCERDLAAAKGFLSEFRLWPKDAAELEDLFRRMVAGDDWYAVLDKSHWPSLDRLIWKSFRCSGFLGAELHSTPRTQGVMMETADVACPRDDVRSETYWMGHRRFRCRQSLESRDDTTDDPGYSIHTPNQVQKIFSEISMFAVESYPDETVQTNFRTALLEPIRYCSEQGLALIARWS